MGDGHNERRLKKTHKAANKRNLKVSDMDPLGLAGLNHFLAQQPEKTHNKKDIL